MLLDQEAPGQPEVAVSLRQDQEDHPGPPFLAHLVEAVDRPRSAGMAADHYPLAAACLDPHPDRDQDYLGQRVTGGPWADRYRHHCR